MDASRRKSYKISGRSATKKKQNPPITHEGGNVAHLPRPEPRHERIKGGKANADTVKKEYSHGYDSDVDYMGRKSLSELDSQKTSSRLGKRRVPRDFGTPGNIATSWSPPTFEIRKKKTGGCIRAERFGRVGRLIRGRHNATDLDDHSLGQDK